MTAGQTWTLVLRAPCPWLNANDNLNRHVREDRVAMWRAASFAAASTARLPKGLARVRIQPVAHFATRRHRDAPNLYPTVKAVVDGLGPPFLRVPTARSKGKAAPGYGLIPNDTDEFLDLRQVTEGPLYAEVAKGYGLPAFNPAFRFGALALVITDLSCEVTA